MDRPSGQSQPGHRDMMFCHECHDEWYRDEHGLTCPECHSDFTEIIEDNNDPRDHDHVDDDDNDSMPDLEAAPPPFHPLHDHNPWHDDDPEEADISGLNLPPGVRWRQVGPGRIAVTMNQTITPQAGGGFGAASAIGGFAALLNGVIRGGGLGQQPGQENQGEQDAGARGTPGVATGSGNLPSGPRFTYSATARLIPRDTDHPANLYPQDEISNVLAGLMAAFGEAPGAHPPHDHDHPHDQDQDFPINPFMHFFAHMMPGNGQAGDFVYSQEALDRIVTQLMEQTATSSAPGPATQAEIDALPRKAVTVEMLGSEGRAECSICMDEVNIEEEVTVLPCNHWFHHACVSAWLSEHDTCPHCRKGISKNGSGSSSANANQQAQTLGGASGSDQSRQMPGAFTSGEGTYADPFVVQSSPAQERSDSQAQPGSAEDGSGGIGDRIRRGLFGPPR